MLAFQADRLPAGTRLAGKTRSGLKFNCQNQNEVFA